MSADPLLEAVVLGLVEGATEFIPVSSTGHLIVASSWLGRTGEVAKTFDIFIQLGAILAIVWLYRARLIEAVLAARTEGPSRRFLLNLLIAFLPAAVVGFLAHDWIKEHLFRVPVVAAALVAGGIVILLIERWRPPETLDRADAGPAPAASSRCPSVTPSWAAWSTRSASRSTHSATSPTRATASLRSRRRT